jgi:hypothetical protein
MFITFFVKRSLHTGEELTGSGIENLKQGKTFYKRNLFC